MANIKVAYGTSTDITPAGLQSLASGSSVATASQNNTSNLYEDYLVEVTIAGTAATTAHVDFYLLSSQGGTNFDTQASASLLGSILLSSTPQQRNFSIRANANLDSCPPYFEILAVNNTGAALAASGNAIKVQGVYFTVV